VRKINDSVMQDAINKNQAPTDSEMRCLEVSESKGNFHRNDSPDKQAVRVKRAPIQLPTGAVYSGEWCGEMRDGHGS